MKVFISILLLSLATGAVRAQKNESVSESARTLNTKYNVSAQRDPQKQSFSYVRAHNEAVQAQRRNYWNLTASTIDYKEAPESAAAESVAIVEKIDNADGSVTVKWADGSVYCGQMYYGEIKGVGTMVYPDGSRYSGAWSNDLPNGSGVFTTSEGVIFETAWTDGVPHGKGVIQDTDGKLYAAKWRNGELRAGTVKAIQD